MRAAFVSLQAIAIVAFLSTSIAAAKSTAASFPQPRFLYVVQSLPTGILGFIVNPTTGDLTPNGQGLVAIAASPASVVAEKNGGRLYVGDLAGNISGFSINRTTGFLSPVPGSPFSAGDTVSAVIVHPLNKFVFASRRHGGVAVFRVAANGSLKQVPGSPFPTVTGANTLTLINNGFLFVGEGIPKGSTFVTSYIDGYRINPATGALTALPNSPYSMGPVGACSVIPTDMAAAGTFLYVADSYESAVSGYTLDSSTGILTEMQGSPFKPICADNNDVNNLNQPSGITIEPTNRSLYGAYSSPNSLVVAQYGITHSGAIGTLAFLTTTPSGTNCGFKLRADPSGKFVYGFGNTASNCSGAPVIAAYGIDAASGQLTPLSITPNILGAATDLAVTP